MATTDARAKMIKLLDTLGELDEDYTEKRRAILAEMSGVLGGGEGIGHKLARLYDYWTNGWQSVTQSDTKFDFKAEKGGMAAITIRLKGWMSDGHSVEQIQARMDRYFASTEEFYRKQRYPFHGFSRLFNTLIPFPSSQPDHSASETSDKLRGLRGE